MNSRTDENYIFLHFAFILKNNLTYARSERKWKYIRTYQDLFPQFFSFLSQVRTYTYIGKKGRTPTDDRAGWPDNLGSFVRSFAQLNCSNSFLSDIDTKGGEEKRKGERKEKRDLLLFSFCLDLGVGINEKPSHWRASDDLHTYAYTHINNKEEEENATKKLKTHQSQFPFLLLLLLRHVYYVLRYGGMCHYSCSVQFLRNWKLNSHRRTDWRGNIIFFLSFDLIRMWSSS